MTAIDLNRNDPVALAGGGEAEFRAGDYVQARRYLDAALAQGPPTRNQLSSSCP